MPASVQFKLSVSSAEDRYEREANTMADRVMRMDRPAPIGSAPVSIHRKCASCEGEAEETVQTKRATSAHAAAAVHDGSVAKAAHGGGEPLAPATREFFEARFGHDFGTVRLHTDREAVEAARSVRARAFTLGEHVAFGSGEYAPGSATGLHLLAHELTHVVQQRANAGGLLQRTPDGPTDNTAQLDTFDDPEYDEDDAEDGDTDVAGGDFEPHGPEPINPPPIPFEPHGPEPLSEAPLDSNADDMPDAEGRKAPGSGSIVGIDVDQEKQVMTLNWTVGGAETHNVCIGRGRSNTKKDPCEKQTEKCCTPNGNFTVVSKGNEHTKNKHGDGMGGFVGLSCGRGIGIHDSQTVFSYPHSHGCIRTGRDLAYAMRINRGVPIGTPVRVHGKAKTKPYKTRKPNCAD